MLKPILTTALAALKNDAQYKSGQIQLENDPPALLNLVSKNRHK